MILKFQIYTDNSADLRCLMRPHAERLQLETASLRPLCCPF